MPAKPAAKSAYHHGDLRQALLDAAVAQVEKSGADSVSLAALARSLGVSQAAPYRHFAERDALLEAVAAEGFKRFSRALAKAPPGRMAHAYVDFGLTHPGLYRLMFDSHVLARASTEELGAVSQGSFGLLVESLPPSDAPGVRQRRAVGIWAALHGVVMLASRGLLQGPTTGAQIDDLIEDIIA